MQYDRDLWDYISFFTPYCVFLGAGGGAGLTYKLSGMTFMAQSSTAVGDLTDILVLGAGIVGGFVAGWAGSHIIGTASYHVVDKGKKLRDIVMRRDSRDNSER